MTEMTLKVTTPTTGNTAPQGPAAGAPAARGGSGRRGAVPRGGRVVPAAVAVLLVLALVLLTRGAQLRGEGDAGNVALTDPVATQQVIGEVSAALVTVFSYAPDTADLTERAAGGLLAGRAAEEYRALFGRVRGEVTGQQLTLRTEVVRAGVTELTEDTAQLLVFLDQTTTRDGRQETATAAAQLSVTAELHDGRWLITALTAR